MLIKKEERENTLKDYLNGNHGKKMISKVIKLSRVYTNPPCNDKESYHRSDQNSMRHVDQRKKICYLCDSKADIIINKKYYCATHGIKLQR